MANSHYDIIIIGAGVIGLTQALALAKENFKIAIVDQAPTPSNLPESFDVRVFALNRYSQKILAQLGIWDKIAATRCASYADVKLFFDYSHLTFHAHDLAEPNLGHIVEQNIWREAALNCLASFSNCDIYWQHQLINANESTITIANSSHQQILTTSLLIGADGVGSKVKQLYNIQTQAFPTNQTALVVNLKLEKTHHFEACQFFGSHGILAFLPLPDKFSYSIVWSIPDEQLATIKQLDNFALTTRLESISNYAWGQIELLSDRHYFPLIQRQSEHYYQDNAVLIGDAAHVIHPLAGQGANLGLADIDALTKLLTQSKDKKLALNHPVLLKRYQRERRSASQQMMFLMSSFQTFSSLPGWLQPVVSLGTSCLDRASFLKNPLAAFALYSFTR